MIIPYIVIVIIVIVIIVIVIIVTYLLIRVLKTNEQIRDIIISINQAERCRRSIEDKMDNRKKEIKNLQKYLFPTDATAYCDECYWYNNDYPKECSHPNNKPEYDQWDIKIKRTPVEINKNNNCKWYSERN